MGDLHAALLAAIEERERLHRTVLAQHPLPWEDSEDGLIWSAKDAPGDPVGGSSDPDVVRLLLVAAEHGLRGLAEDRDILRRHAPQVVPLPEMFEGRFSPRVYCAACEGVDADGARDNNVDFPCEWVLSLARRHGMEAS